MNINKIYMGIDPGLSGACVYLWGNGVYVFQTPILITKKFKKNKKKKMVQVNHREYDIRALLDRLEDIHGVARSFKATLIAGLESVHAFPKQGSVSNFSFGKGYGTWITALESQKISYQLITPQKWKKYFGLIGCEKNAAVEKVKKLFASSLEKNMVSIYGDLSSGETSLGVNMDIDRRLNHNHADAILIALYLKQVGEKNLC